MGGLKRVVNKKGFISNKKLFWNHLFWFFLCFGVIYLFGSGCSSNKNGYQIATEFTEQSSEPSQIITVTPSPNPTQMIPTVTLIPTSTPMRKIEEKLLICEEESLVWDQMTDHDWEFFWLNIACDTRLNECSFSKEPYFAFDYQFREAAHIQDFSNDKSTFLFIPSHPWYDRAYSLFEYDAELMYRREFKIIGDTTAAAYSADNTKLVLLQDASNFLVLNENGNNQYISTNYWIHHAPSLSPDNRWIAFIADSKKKPGGCYNDFEYICNFNLFLIDLNEAGKILKTSTRPVGDSQENMLFYWQSILWSEDSNWTIYAGQIDDYEVICVYDIDVQNEKCFDQYLFDFIDEYELKNQKLLIEGSLHNFDMESVSDPIALKNADSDIYILDLDSEELRSIAVEGASEIDPTWSENGDYIFYSKFIFDTWQIYLTDTYNSFHKQITFSNMDHYVNGMCSGY